MSALFLLRFLLSDCHPRWLAGSFTRRFIKKRKWKQLQNDALAVAFFAAYGMALTFFFID
jgi:hypothetical protein